MNVKSRKQGNSLMITIPKEFNIGEGVEFEPILENDGLKYKFKKKQSNFRDDFDDLILRDLLERGISDNEDFIREFQEMKSKLPAALQELIKEGKKDSKVMTREEFEQEIGL